MLRLSSPPSTVRKSWQQGQYEQLIHDRSLIEPRRSTTAHHSQLHQPGSVAWAGVPGPERSLHGLPRKTTEADQADEKRVESLVERNTPTPKHCRV